MKEKLKNLLSKVVSRMKEKLKNLLSKVVSPGQVVFTAITVCVVVGLVYSVLAQRGELGQVGKYLANMELWPLLFLIMIVFEMYEMAGLIWAPYLDKQGHRLGTLARIQYELNFVNTMVPFMSISGLVYAQMRMKGEFDTSPEQTVSLYSFRYMVSIATKWIEIMVAVGILMLTRKIADRPEWLFSLPILLGCLIIIGFGILAVIMIMKPKKLTVWLNKQEKGIGASLREVLEMLETMFTDKGALLLALIYGLIYSLLEIMPFWVVAAAMGRPDLLLEIIIASGIGTAVGVLVPTPMGIGGFEGAMVWFLGQSDQNVALATAIVVTTRALILAGTTLTGLPFWLGGMKKIQQQTKEKS